MGRVYSTQLANEHLLGGGALQLIGGPAAGHVQVLRHMTAIYPPVAITTKLNGFEVSIGTSAAIWVLGLQGVGQGITYDWSGRHVITDVQTIDFFSSDAPGWGILISGYDLTLP